MTSVQRSSARTSMQSSVKCTMQTPACQKNRQSGTSGWSILHNICFTFYRFMLPKVPLPAEIGIVSGIEERRQCQFRVHNLNRTSMQQKERFTNPLPNNDFSRRNCDFLNVYRSMYTCKFAGYQSYGMYRQHSKDH